MRVTPPVPGPWQQVHRLPMRARPDELLDQNRTDLKPIAFGSLALQVQPEIEEPGTPDLLWPPVLTEDPRPRGRPVRVNALWRVVAKLSRAEARAALLVAQDLHTHALKRRVRLPTRGAGHLVERSHRYYSAGGDLTPEQARHALGILTLHLRASAVPLSELIRARIPLRDTRGQRHGQHWFLTRDALNDIAIVLGLLHAHGIRRPASSRTLRAIDPQGIALNVRVKGRRWWAVCPLHGDHDPSLLLNAHGSAWCFGCCAIVGQWIDADLDEDQPDRTPSRVIFHAFIDAESARDRSAPRRRPTDEPRTTPPPMGSYEEGCAGVGRSVSDLGLHRYSRSKASRAGAPGVHPAQKYFGHFDGRRDWVRKSPTTQTYIRKMGESRREAVLNREARPVGLVLGARKAWGMSQGYAASLDLIEVMQTAEVRSRSDRAMSKAQDAYEVARSEHVKKGWRGNVAADTLPDLFVSLDHQSHTVLRDGPDRALPAWPEMNLPEALLTVTYPAGFEPVSARWIGIDVDRLGIPSAVVGCLYGEDELDAPSFADMRGGANCLGDDALRRAAENQIRTALEQHPDFTGRFGLIRTGPRGVQVVAELELSRWNPRALWADPDFRGQAENLARVVLGALRAEGCTDGEIDSSSFAPGRYVRRPGWRIAKDGRLFRARLIFHTS